MIVNLDAEEYRDAAILVRIDGIRIPFSRSRLLELLARESDLFLMVIGETKQAADTPLPLSRSAPALALAPTSSTLSSSSNPEASDSSLALPSASPCAPRATAAAPATAPTMLLRKAMMWMC
jgi:hypothetical protein